jgi:cytochrome c peroxidase
MIRLLGMMLPAAAIAIAVWVGVLMREEGLSALPRDARSPADGSATQETVELGRLLFWDPILSGPKDVACATCHHPDFGYAERLDLSIGIDGVGLGAERRFATGDRHLFVKRNSQTILNVAFNGMAGDGSHDPVRAPMFWDLRTASLEAQALEPLKTFEEMRGWAYSENAALGSVVSRLDAIAEYRARFSDVFEGASPVSAENLGRALAAFQRSLVTADTPFDRFQRGDQSAMTPLQVRGMRRFVRIGCSNCHTGPMFSDYRPHTLGVPDNPKLTSSDAGIDERYAFRTPTLRNLRHTAPYMHNGMLATLEDVIAFYDDVSNERSRNPKVRGADLESLVSGLNVGEDAPALVAFLDALSDEAFDRTVPAEVPSGLPVGGRIREKR